MMIPEHPRINPDRDRQRKLYLDDEVLVDLTDGNQLRIPKGYRFDGHSVPRLFWSFFPPYDQDVYAALVHDYLIDTIMFHRYKRKFIDKQYKVFMNHYKATWARTFFMPKLVRFYGIVTHDWRGM